MSKHKPNKRITTRDLALIALSISMLVICSYISLPTIAGHITLQIFAVLLIAASFDLKKSFISVGMYLLLGLLGLPLFAGFRGGPVVLFDVSGGYLFGFLLISLLIPLARKLFGNSILCTLISSVLSLLMTYAIATLWFMVVTNAELTVKSFGFSMILCVLPYVAFDAVKLALALCCAPRFRKFIAFSDKYEVMS